MKYNAATQEFEGIDFSKYKIIDILVDRNYKIFLKCRNIENKQEYVFVEVINFHNHWYKRNENGEYKTLFGEKCSKTYNFNEADFEKDIHSEYRFLINHYEKIIKNLNEDDVNIVWYDIETYKSLAIKETPERILSIAFYSTLDKKNYCYYLKNKKDLTNDKRFLEKNIHVICFENEKTMLETFVKEIKKADIVYGFNSNFFDDLYLINRARKLGVKEHFGYFKDAFINDRVYENRFEQALMDKGSPIFSELNFIDIKPIVTKLFARGNFVDKPSKYSLSEIGKILNLEEQKISLTDGPATLWDEDRIEELIEYNVQDVIVTKEITTKMKITEMILTRKNLFKLNFSLLFKNSKIIDFLILSRYKNIVFPTITYDNKESVKFEGAYVMNTKHGLYHNVGVLDFAAMYPNIIIGFNISPETVIDREKHLFSQETTGLLSDILKFTLEQRYVYKDLAKDSFAKGDIQSHDIYKMQEHQLKDMINSIYGVFAYKYFRLFDVDVASAITYYGREIIKNTIKHVDTLEDFFVLYGDSDSFFAHYKHPTSNNVEVFENLEKQINIFLKQEWENKMKEFTLRMECETIFNFLILPQAKKTYIGLTSLLKGAIKENELYAKGFSLIRKDTPRGLKPLLQTFYNDFLINVANKEMSRVKKDLLEIKSKMKTLDYKDFLISKQMNAEPDKYKVIPQHVRAMLYSNTHLKTDFSRANYSGGCLYVKVKSKYPQVEIIALDDNTPLPKEMVVDYNKYFEMFIKNKIILLNKNFEELFSQNKSLIDYM